MAKIEFEAFIEAWTKNNEQHPSWGMKTAEAHSRKNDQGRYETVGRTFRTVKVSRSSGLQLTDYPKGARVKVTGTEVTETREHEGKKYYDLIVWADSVEPVGGQPSQTAQPAADTWDNPQTPSDDRPF